MQPLILCPARPAARASLALALAAGVTLSLPLHAQESEAIISSASRYGQSAYEAPASVTVVTREEIRRFGYRTLGEVLAAAGGMFTSYDRNYTYLTVRGLAKRGDFNTRVLVLLDGRRLNRPADDSSLLGTEGVVDLETVERVEIIRGPGSTLYGTNAFYAVVNLVTRTGASAKGAEAQLAGGSFESGYASLAGGTRTAAGFDLFAAASGYATAGPDLYFPEHDEPGTGDGRAIGLDGDRFARTLVRLARGDFSAEGFYSSRRKEIPTGSYDTVFGDPRARTHEGGGMLSAAYEHAFADLSRVWATASYESLFYDGDYPYEDGLLSDYVRSRWVTVEGQYQQFVGGRHRVSVGGEARRNLRLEVGVPGTLEDRRSSWVLAGFLQGELHFGERLTLYAGGRYDHYEGFGGTFNPRVALVAEPVNGTYLKGIYGRAFRAPSAYELHYEDGSLTQKPALTLEPERLETFEVALERHVRPGLRATASVYHTRVNDLIGLVTDPADGLLVYTNGETARSTGVEVGLDGYLTSRLFARASYAFQQAEEGAAELRPVGSPRHVAHLATSLSLLEGQLVPGLELHYLGARTTLAGAQAPSHARAGLTLQLRPRSAARLEVLAKLGNLLATEYSDPGGEEHRQDLLQQDGRTAWLSVRFRF
jgi:iron complex outermembrane receptor protein